MMNRRDVAIGLFHDPERARDAINGLKDAGFSGNDISLLMPDRGQARALAEETGTRAGEGAATGLIAGGVLGGLAGWLVGVGALAIPAVGPFIAAGAFATALGGAAIGAGVGAIAGALVGMGIPEEEARYYEQEVRGGRTLVAVRAGSRMTDADDLLHQYGAYDVEHRDPSSMASGTSGLADAAPVERNRYDRAETLTTGVGATSGEPMSSGTMATSGDGGWEDVSAGYRGRWQERMGQTGGRWEDYEPQYRYGWEARNDPRYRDRAWPDVESDLRRDWEGRYADRPWDQARENVRAAWEGVSEPTRRMP
jgi:hypothetical protein